MSLRHEHAITAVAALEGVPGAPRELGRDFTLLRLRASNTPRQKIATRYSTRRYRWTLDDVRDAEDFAHERALDIVIDTPAGLYHYERFNERRRAVRPA